jgi:hypothetical protein
MNHFSLSRLQGLSRTLVALIATSAVFTAGCANMATTATGSSSLNPDASISGHVHGGNQPVAGATVNLWFAGQGAGAPASIAATTKSATDGTGSFGFVKGSVASGNTYVCPSSGDPLVYLVATGGDTVNSTDSTGSNSNPASVFIAALGDCNTIGAGTFVDMTEVTTVATMAALQQYFDPSTETFSTDGSSLAYTAMTNALTTIPNLVNSATGQAITTQTILPASAGQGHGGTSVTATPESAKINTLANILASCINNASLPAANCTTLFSNVVHPDPATTARPSSTFPPATDVLEAIYYILTNPTNGSTTNLTNLYNLSPASGAPFQPVLTSAPSDWTIAIVYSSTSPCGSSTGHLIHSAQDLAVDTYGNIWMANNETGGNLSAITPSGAPLTCVTIGSGANTGITIDSLGTNHNISDIWLADNGSSNVYRYNPGTNAILAFPTATAPTSLPPFAIGADGSGNIYFTSPTDAALYEIPGAVAAGAAVAPVAIATTIGSVPAHIMVDNTPAVWTTSGSTYITRTTPPNPIAGTPASSAQITTPSTTYGITVTAAVSGSNNLVYVSEDGANFLDQFQGGPATTYSEDANWPVAGGITPAEVASDGAKNVWTIDNGANAVVEVGANLQALSPSGGFQKSAGYLGSGTAITIDQAGNVWIGLNGANAITEIVGAAVPVYQPYATALKGSGNLFQTIP